MKMGWQGSGRRCANRPMSHQRSVQPARRGAERQCPVGKLARPLSFDNLIAQDQEATDLFFSLNSPNNR